MRRRFLPSALLGALVSLPAFGTELWIVSPSAGQPATGEVEFAIEVVSDEAIREVVLEVDGREVARLGSPPYRVTVDVGQENVEHLFEASVEDASGVVERGSWRTPAWQVDEELELELQQLYVTVTRAGERVLDIDRAAFEVFDDGERQKIVTFAGGEVPFTAVLVIDASLSMRGRPLRRALSGARSFFDGLDELDEASLLLFSDRLLHLTPFTNDSRFLARGLDAVEGAGGSAVNDHLYLALKLLEVRQGRRVVILLSDGGDIESALDFEAVEWSAGRGQAMIYWIRPRRGGEADARLSWSSAWRDAEEHRRQFQGLERLVGESGGRIVDIGDIAEALTTFEEILAELRGQYVIGYYPSNRREDGSWHRTRVRLRGESGTVRVREGYVDD